MMNSPRRRHDRLAEQIQAEVAEIIATELKDPRIGFATVTRVELSPDFYLARVMVSVLGDDATRHDTLAGLVSAAGYVRHEIAHRLRLRRVPEVVFILDHGPQEASRIEEMLQRLRKDEG